MRKTDVVVGVLSFALGATVAKIGIATDQIGVSYQVNKQSGWLVGCTQGTEGERTLSYVDRHYSPRHEKVSENMCLLVGDIEPGNRFICKRRVTMVRVGSRPNLLFEIPIGKPVEACDAVEIE